MGNRVVHQRGRSVVERSPTRASIWFDFQPARVALTAAGGTVIASLNTAALNLLPFTIIRSRFELFIDSDQAAVDEVQVAGFGIAVVSDQAVVIGVTAIPTPITDMSSDLWFVHKIVYGGATPSDAAGRGGNVGLAYTVDSKAMRKVVIGQDIVIVGEFSSVGSGLRLTVAGRMLIKTL